MACVPEKDPRGAEVGGEPCLDPAADRAVPCDLARKRGPDGLDLPLVEPGGVEGDRPVCGGVHEPAYASTGPWRFGLACAKAP
jgi:hypothetical protein